MRTNQAPSSTSGQVKFNPKDDEVDDAIAALNPAQRRRDSQDSINFRETMEGGHRRGDSGGGFMQPMPLDNDNTYNTEGAAGAFLEDEEKDAEEQRRREEA